MPRAAKSKLSYVQKYDRRRRACSKQKVSIPLGVVTVLQVSISTCRVKPIPQHFNEAHCSNLQVLQCKLEAFSLLPPQWVLSSIDSSLHIVKLCSHSHQSTSTTVITALMTLTVYMDFHWTLMIKEHRVDVSEVPALENMPSLLHSSHAVVNFLTVLDASTLCVGNPEDNFTSYVRDRKGTIYSQSGVQSSV